MPEEVRADLLLGRDTMSPGLLKAGRAAADASSNVRQLTRDLYEAGKQRATPIIDLQDKAATAKLDQVTQKLRDLGAKAANPAIDVNDKAALASVAAMRVKLDALGKKVSSPRVTLEGLARAEAGILALDAQLDRLGRKRETVTIHERISGLAGAGFLQPSALGAAAGLLPALIPVAATLSAAVAAVGVSFGAAGAGALGFGKVASGVLQQAQKDEKQLQALNLRLNAATTASARQAIRQQIAALKQGWTPAFRQVMNDLDTLTTRWKATEIQIAAPALVPWLGTLKLALPAVRTALQPVADLFQSWGQSLRDYFSSSQGSAEIHRIASAFGAFSAGQLAAIGTFIVDIGQGVFALGRDIAGSGANFYAFGEDLANWGNAFATWAKSSAARSDVRGFLAYIHGSGHTLASILGDLARILPGIFRGASAAGQLELKAVSGFLGFIARLPKGWQAPLTEAAGALLLLSKTGVLKVGIQLVGGAAKLLTGGELTLGGASAAAEIRGAFTSGGAAAAEEIRLALAGGAAAGAAGGGEAAAGGGIAGIIKGKGLLWGTLLAGAFIYAVNRKLPVVHKSLWQLGDPPGPGQRATWYNSWSQFGKDIGHGFIAGTETVFPSLTRILGDPFHKAAPVIHGQLQNMEGDVTRAKQNIASSWKVLYGPLHDPFQNARDQNKVSLHTMEGDVYGAKGDISKHWGLLYGDLISPFDSARRQNRASLHTMEGDVYGAKQRINRDWQDLHGKHVALTFGLDLPAGVSFPSRHIKGRAAGWRVPGYGGGDRWPALLEGGEAVVPKHLTPAVAPFLGAHKVPGFAAGGLAGGTFSYSDVFRPPVGVFLHDLNRDFSAAERLIISAVRRNATLTGGLGGGLGRQSLRQIEDYWMAAGGPGGIIAHIAAAITGAESGFNPRAIQQGQPYATTGWGLWQITPGNSEPQAGTDYQLLSPFRNAIAAVAKFRQAGGSFAPWTTFNDGAYLQFMDKGGFLRPGWNVVLNRTGYPEMVTPHPRAGGGGGAVRVVLEIDVKPGAGPVEHAIADLLRHGCKVRNGGNVQAYLGRR